MADHVEDEAEGGLVGPGAPAAGVVAAAVEAVVSGAGEEFGGRHVEGEGFLAIEEDEFELPGVVGAGGEAAGQFEDDAGGGGGVVGAEEGAVREVFRVDVGAEEALDGAGPEGGFAGGAEAGEEVDEGERALGAAALDVLAGDLPAGFAEAGGEVGAGLGEGGGTGRTGAEGEDFAGVMVGGVGALEIRGRAGVPGFFPSAGGEEGCRYQDRGNGRKGAGGHRGGRGEGASRGRDAGQRPSRRTCIRSRMRVRSSLP